MKKKNSELFLMLNIKILNKNLLGKFYAESKKFETWGSLKKVK